jgi:hypothetical protein
MGTVAVADLLAPLPAVWAGKKRIWHNATVNFGDDGEILPFLLSLGTLLTNLTSGEQNGQPAIHVETCY